ncbi:MAG: hypothetical protein EB045_05360 [Actinobacteria bacterium]|nr:hypothetical protein [Actinomycetota bacterium]
MIEKKKIALVFKEETTPSGNVQKVANIKATLVRLSDREFTYTNGNGDTLTYKLATIRFTDDNGNSHTKADIVVYSTSYEQGMEIGETYLGKVSRSKNADGTARKPWYTLSSLVVASENSDEDFEEVEVSEEIGI